MRFGTAATILAIGATTPGGGGAVVASHDEGKKNRRGGDLLLSTSDGSGFNEKKLLTTAATTSTSKQHHKKNSNKIRRHLQKKMIQREGETRRLVNNAQNKGGATNQQHHLIKCDPYSLDMGILACGKGNYCIESHNSPLGGFCSSSNNSSISGLSQRTSSQRRRKMQSGNGGEIPEEVFYGECDYDDGFDQDTGYGTYVCTSVSTFCYLESDVFPCCYAFDSSITYGADGYVGVTYTFSFSEPYSQNVTRTTTVSGDGATEDYNCEIIFNGVACNSCVVQPPTLDDEGADGEQDRNYIERCYEFDCTNVPPGMAGNTCDSPGRSEVFIPILSQCFAETTGCNICNNNGGALLYPNATVGLDGNDVTCNDAFVYTYYTTIDGTTDCTYFQYYFGNVCCEGDVSPCNICGDDDNDGQTALVNPDATVNIPGYDSPVSCSDLYYGQGVADALIYSQGCPLVSSLATPICCDVEDTEPQPCLVCPDDADVTDSDVIIEVPGQPRITCTQLQDFGRMGLIPQDLCEPAQLAVPDICGCGGGGGGTEPTPPDTPTEAPVDGGSSSSQPPSMMMPTPSSDSPAVPQDEETDSPTVMEPVDPPPPATDPPTGEGSGSISHYSNKVVAVMPMISCLSLLFVSYMAS